MIGHWTFDSADTNWAGNTTADISGSNNTGTLTNFYSATSTTGGHIYESLSFDGNNDYVLAGTIAGGTITGSVCFWVKRSGSKANPQLINFTANGGTGFVYLYTNNSTIAKTSGTVYVDSQRTTAFPGDGEFHNVCVTGMSIVSNGNTYIGANSSGTGSWLGLLDDFRIYNRTLSATDVAQLYNTGFTPIVTTSGASSITDISATLNGSTDMANAASSTSRGFAYGTDSTLSTVIATTTEAGGPFGSGVFTQNISGLTENTTYYFRAYSANATSTGFGSILSFTSGVPASVSPPSLLEANFSLITQVSAVASSTITSVGGSNVSNRGFAYGTDSTFANVIATTTETGDFGTGQFSSNLTSLICNTTYYVRAYAVNSYGTSTASSANFTTSPCVPSIPTSVSAVSTLRNQATITFTPGSDGGSSILYYLASSTPGNITATSTGSPITVTGLTNGVVYTFQVYAVNAVGTSTPSVFSNAVTPDATATGLGGHWTFDTTNTNWLASTTADSSGNGNTGTLTNFYSSTSTVAGFDNQGLYFNGGTEYIDAGTGQGLSPTSAITISTWIKPIGKSNSNYLAVVGKKNSYFLDIRDDGIILFYLTGVKNWLTQTTSDKNLFDGVWHNLVAKYDGSIQSIYIDGLFIASTTATGNINTSFDNLQIGRRGTTIHYKGSMDDVRIYSSSLTESEIQSLYLSYGQTRTPQTYYISSTLGNDENDGLSESTPWQNIDKIYKIASLPYGFVPGDQILLKRGDTWEGQIRLDRIIGTGSDPITIGAYGSNSDPKPIIYGDGRNLTWTAVDGYSGVYEANIGAGSNITSVFENSTAYTSGTSGNVYTLSPGQWGVKPFGRSDLVWIRTQDGGLPSNIRVFRYTTISMKDSENIVIGNLDLRETFIAIYAYGSDSITSRNINTLNTLDSAVIYTQYTTNSTIENSSFDTTGNSTVYLAFYSSNNTISNNIISGASETVSGINVSPGDDQAVGLHTGTGNIIENNTVLSGSIDFYYENDSILRYNIFESAQSGYYPHGTNLTIYGNIGGLGGNSVNTGVLPIKIFHNLIRGYMIGGNGGGQGESTGSILFYNNIVYNTTNNALMNFGSVVDSDYNCFYNTNANYSYTYNSVSYHSLASYQSGTGHDLHSVFSNPNLEGNRISSDSPCKNIGTDVSSEINFPYVDYVGVSIPQGVAPDAGAYEYIPTPTVSVSTASLISAYTATLNGSIDATGGANASARGFEWGSTDSYGTIVSTTGSYSTGSFSTNLSNLICDTTYHFRSFATNNTGTASSSDATFTTSACSSVSNGSSRSSSGSRVWWWPFRASTTTQQTQPQTEVNPPLNIPVTKKVVDPITPNQSEPEIAKDSRSSLIARLFKRFSLALFSKEEKKILPSEVVFAKPANLPSFDVSTQVSLQTTPVFNTQATIHVPQGKPIDLAVKADKPVKEVTGYLTIKKIDRKTALLDLEKQDKSGVNTANLASVLSALETIPEDKFVLLAFKYTDPDSDGIYTATIDSPKVTGEYDIMTILEYKDKKLGYRELHLTAVIDPEGYVYHMTGKEQTRITNAKLTLYVKDSKTEKFIIWPADQFKQINPQTTDITGNYSFLVPEGIYQLSVTAPDYYNYTGDEFTVTQGAGVHENIELTKCNWLKSLWRWFTGMF
ncbi:MAG: LamG-like jellyroll fold domain-containing protein [Candidatus Taylorbacteria bacterium]